MRQFEASRTTGPPPASVVWLYERDHNAEAMLRQGIASLLAAGCRVVVVDRAQAIGGRRPDFRHVALNYKDPARGWPKRLGLPGLAYRSRTPSYLVRSVWHAAAERPSVIIATGYRAIVAGWIASRLSGARSVYYPLELYGGMFGPVSPWWLRLESLIVRTSIDALITQNEGRATVYVEEGRSRVTPVIVQNYKLGRPVNRSGKLRAHLNLPDDCRIVLYQGVLNAGRRLEELAATAAYLPGNTRLVFMGMQRKWWAERVEALLSRPEAGGKILTVPEVPSADVASYASDADVGVIIYDGGWRNYYYGAPGKLSTYVLAGVPVVAPNFPTIAPVVREYGIGAIFDSPEPAEIARAINHVFSVPRATWQAALQRAQKDLVWETQEPAFVRAVTGAELASVDQEL